jgi:hypothetical protein
MHIRSANNFTASIAKWGNEKVLHIKRNKKRNNFHMLEKFSGWSDLDRILWKTGSGRGYELAAR